MWYLVEILHELQVALLADQQVQVLLPVSVHSLDVSLQHRVGGGHQRDPRGRGEPGVPPARPSCHPE